MKQFISLFTFSLVFISSSYGQNVVVSSGGAANGNGSISFTIGQVFVNTTIENTGSSSEGIQKSIEIYTLSSESSELSTLRAIAYPNPTKGFITLRFTDEIMSDLHYKVYSIQGKEIKSGKLIQQNTNINLNPYSTGIYLIHILRNSNPLNIFKIVKN